MADWNRDEEFDEEEVWFYEKDHHNKEDSSPTSRKVKDFSSSSSAWRLPSAPRVIPRVQNSSSSHETKMVHHNQQSSAPVNIPDWSKVYGKHANLENGSFGDGLIFNNVGNYNGYGKDDDVDDDDDDDDDMVHLPPHEWLARKLARSQISSFSVCEGMGRTLKGRDLSKVRNAVLTKTGFLE